jgi:hypothetical protein
MNKADAPIFVSTVGVKADSLAMQASEAIMQAPSACVEERKKNQEKNVTRMQAQPASQLASRLHVGATDAGGWIYVEGKVERGRCGSMPSCSLTTL